MNEGDFSVRKTHGDNITRWMGIQDIMHDNLQYICQK